MFSKKIFKVVASLLAFTVIFTLSACNGDMHDDDEALKSYVVFSSKDNTLSVPAGAKFHEDFEAYGIEGTYGEYKFSYMKVIIDDYDSRMILKDSNGSVVKEFNSGKSWFELEQELVIKITSTSSFPIDKWNNIKYQ